MSSQLFAFQLAQPLESRSDERSSGYYDHQSQLLVWESGTRAQSYYYCSGADWSLGYVSCSAYGSYCTVGDKVPEDTLGYDCDWW